MAEETPIGYTDLAVDDLDIIFSYICEDNRAAALAMVDQIEKTIFLLAVNPRLGAALSSPEPRQEENIFRYIVAKPYIIFYKYMHGEIFIARILHSRQDWLNLIFTGIK